MNHLYLAAAVVLMCAAHFLRVLRWELFIKVYEKPDRKRLISALSLGYAVNSFVPYKLGDLARGFYAGRSMKNGKALGLSTVIVDRYLDVIAVGVIFTVLSLSDLGNESLIRASGFYVLLFAALIAATVLVFALRNLLKRLIRAFAGLFNRRIEGSVLRFAWALIWNFKDIVRKIKKLSLLLYTLGMWGIYILSYAFFGRFITSFGVVTDWKQIFLDLFGAGGVKASTLMLALFQGKSDRAGIWFLVYMFLPLLVLFLVSLVLPKRKETGDESTYLNLIPQLNPSESLEFLDRYFSGESRDYINNYLAINRDVSVLRDYSAGSNATTILCVGDGRTFFRKYAFGKDAAKLSEQIRWIRENADRLPLPEILRSEENEVYCYYDMPYLPDAVGLFEYAHSMPLEKSEELIGRVLEKLKESLYVGADTPVEPETVRKYVSGKVTANLAKIRSSRRLKALTEYKTLMINGREYRNLDHYERYLTPEYLEGIFAEDVKSPVHGDLTVENIVCRRNADSADFYLIDPNTGNILDSPALDLGKLMQSLHGGYEFLMAVRDVKITENRIDFLFPGSHAYSGLWAYVDGYIAREYPKEILRSVYFHEVVHWLRLMPYKIDKDPRTAPVFYAGLIMVLDDVYKRFIVNEEV